MSNIEKILNEKKEEINELKVPDELEERLQASLEDKTTIKSKGNWKMKIVSLLVIIMIGLNINTVAYYGKKFIRYDNIMNRDLKKLNELGKGQIIDKSYTFKNGVMVTLNGIMLDDNQLLAFYTIKNMNGNEEKIHIDMKCISGKFGTYYKESGKGEVNKNKNEEKWITSFKKPKFIEKKLKMQCVLRENSNVKEEGEIVFILDKNKAMKHLIKKKVNKEFNIDERKIKIDSIIASETSTVVKGTIQNIFQLGIDEVRGNRIRPEYLDIVLIANGDKIALQCSELTTNMKGIKFSYKYDRLPKNLKNLQIKLVSFSADYDVDYKVKLKKGKENKKIQILGEDVYINNVHEVNGETYVTITTKESTILSKVFLNIDGKKVKLDKTIFDKQNKIKDELFTNTRTLKFKETGENITLNIERIKCQKKYNKGINMIE